jgi:hypothetical protein
VARGYSQSRSELPSGIEATKKDIKAYAANVKAEASRVQRASDETTFSKLAPGTDFQMFDGEDLVVGESVKTLDDLETKIADYFGSEDPEDIYSSFTADFIENNPQFIKELDKAKEGAYEGGHEATPSAYQSPTATEQRFDYSFGDGSSGDYTTILKFPGAPSIEMKWSVEMSVSYSYDFKRDQDEESISYRTSVKNVRILT